MQVLYTAARAINFMLHLEGCFCSLNTETPPSYTVSYHLFEGKFCTRKSSKFDSRQIPSLQILNHTV